MLEWLLLTGMSLATALAALAWLQPALLSRRSNRVGLPRGEGAVWLYDGKDLLDQSDRARLLFDGPAEEPDWDGLSAWLRRQFPGFPQEQTVIRNMGRIEIAPQDSTAPGRVVCEWLDGVIRVHLAETGTGEAEGNGLLATQRRELDHLRSAVDHAPYPIWRLSENGEVNWKNAAYVRLGESGATAGMGGTLFPLASGAGLKRRRMPVAKGSGRKHWFDVSVVEDEPGALCYAVDVDATVEAEDAQRQFVQTLAKTFAQLSIGLAIFDRNRQLALFNPALVDLTSLSPEFLSGRPNMLSFFDRLRDQNMMPEPKNYSSWRHQMADLVAAASDGRYHETWSLPSGSVYSVSGRPHPDGAIAFLFEDITAEITLTRRFRADLEMGQAILDRLDQAIAVFAADGSLTVSNAEYRNLWNVDPDESFAPVTVVDATRTWAGQCRASPLWGEIRDFVAMRENRTDWTFEVTMTGGAVLSCRATPLPKGATMVSFQIVAAAAMPMRNGHAMPVSATG
ncbi:MAG: PAS-domain containing protein [Pseudooceanicola sp.]|nr:PAS-domain containing protein [Pseudooceanicola sp.]